MRQTVTRAGERRFILRLGALAAVLAAFGALPAYALDPAALPTGGQVAAGSATISHSNARMNVNQATQQAIINWSTFNIGSSASVNFAQPSSSSVALNRVTASSGASEIMGSLTANGQVFLVNPSGVLFGKTAQVDVGAMVATSLNISDANFLAGRYTFASTGAAGTVINEGALRASDGGYIALLAPEVRNQGLIAAHLGTVALAAGNKVTLDFAGDRLVSLAIDEAALNALAENRSVVQADGGTVILAARAAGDLASTVVNNTGLIQATSVSVRDGVIRLEGGERGVVAVSGTLDASGRGPGERGGTIKVLGDRVALSSGATLDASGDAGGGTVLVGGNYLGSGPEQNASATHVAQGARVKADALTSGDGGRVIIWSDEYTGFSGTISARGGAASGNGGFVETSSKNILQATGMVDASAPAGQGGEWLLDPNSITIQTAGPDTNVTGNPDFTTTNDNAIVTVGSIQTALNAGTSVTVTTGSAGTNSQVGDITVANAIAKTAGGNATLTLNATNGITFNAGADVTSSASQLNLTLNAGAGGIASLQNVNTNGGVLTFNSSGAMTQAGVISGSGSVVKQGSGTLTLSSANTYSGSTTISGGTLRISSDGNLGTAPGAATPGHLTLGGGALETTATLTLNANRGIALGTGGGTIDVDSGTTLTYGGIVAGANALTKTDAGTLLLAGASSYTGATAVNGGTLRLSGASGTATGTSFTVNQGGTLELDNSAANNTNRLSDANPLTLNGGEFVFRGTNVAATNASETAGALTLASGASTVTAISGAGGSSILTFASANRSAGATVLFRGSNLGAATGAGTANILFTAPAGLSLVGSNSTQTNKPIVPYAIGDTAPGGSGIGFVTYNINPASNAANATGIRPLALATEYTANAITTGNNIRLTANTTVPGNRTINSILLDGGNLAFNNNNRTVTVTSGAVARTSGGGVTSNANATRVLAFGVNEAIFHAIGSFAIASNVTGTGGFTKSGTGTLTLNTRVKALTGGYTINEGTLASGINGAINAGNAVTIRAAGTLNLATFTNTITTLGMESGGTLGATLSGSTGNLTLGGTVTHTLNGSGATGASITKNLALGANRILDVADGTASDDLSVSGVVSGAFTVTKQGAGTLRLSGANTYTGLTTVSAGTLAAASNTALGGTGAGTSVASGATLAIDGAGLTIAEPITSLIGTGMSGGGALRNLGNNNTWTGAITLGAGGARINSDAGTLTISGAGNITGAGQPLTIGGAGDTTISKVIGTTTGTLTKDGSGTLTLSGANTYTGTTTINGGTLSVNSIADVGGGASALGAPTTVANGTIALGAGTLRYTGTGDTSNRVIDLTGAGTVDASGSGTLTLTGGVTGATQDLTLTGTGDGVQSGVIGITTGSVTKAGTGTWTLSGANTYSGTTAVSGGTLVAANASGLGTTGGGTTVSSGATLNINNVAIGAEAVTLNGNGVGGAGALTGTGTASLAGTLTLAGASRIGTTSGASTLTLNGGVDASGFALDITGPGNLTATNALNDFGTVTINSAGNVSLVDANALTIGASSVGTLIAQTLSGDLTLGGNVTATGSGDTIVLAAAANFNNSGANSLDPNTGGGGRWLVYSTNPASDNRGGLVYGFKQYDATYGVTPVADASNNGFLYTIAPTITPSLGGTATKVYDGATTAPMGSLTLSPVGAIDGDTVVLAMAGAAYDTRNAGSGKTVTANGISLTSATNGAATVYGYQLSPTSASAAVGTIDPRAITVTAVTDTKTYDGSTSSAGTPTISAGSLAPIGGDTAAFTQSFDTRNAGTNKTLTPAGAVNDGNGGANYAITYFPSAATGVITAAPLTVMADNQTRPELTPNPPFTATYSGFQGGDSSSSLGGALVFATPATTASPAGTYPVTPSGLTSGDYTISFVDGVLTVTAGTGPLTPVSISAAAGAIASTINPPGDTPTGLAAPFGDESVVVMMDPEDGSVPVREISPRISVFNCGLRLPESTLSRATETCTNQDFR